MKQLLVPPLVPSDIGTVRFDLGKSIWLWGILTGAVAFGIPLATKASCAFAVALAVLTICVGHSVGLHRGIIHRTYQTSPRVRGVLAYLFVLTGLGGPLSWARLHAVRDHWQNQVDCPAFFAYRHGLLQDFFWLLHLSFRPSDDRALARLPAGVLSDRWLLFLERTWPLHVAGSFLLLGLAFGPAGIAVCGFGRVAAGILVHWFVGYAGHAWGEQRYEVSGAAESGTNVWLLGVLSFGEGFHNNHHAFPGSARMGFLPREFDLGFAALQLLARLGVVWDVKQAAPSRTGSEAARGPEQTAAA